MVEIIACRRCDAPLSRPVTRRDKHDPRPRRVDEPVNPGYLPTMDRGAWSVAPGPLYFDSDYRPLTTLGCLVLHPEDGFGLEPHPDDVRIQGCCGPAGMDGPNQRCAVCHAEVATLADDCWTVVELRFEPTAVRFTEAADGLLE